MKWTANDFKRNNKPRHLLNWKPPKFIYPCDATELSALKGLQKSFNPLPPYKRKSDPATGMESDAIQNGTLVDINTPIPDGHIAFLENTAEQCTSPETKHSREGKESARHWTQRIDTPEGVFKRLTDGYGISLMFGERFHQFIRNSNNWRGASGILLDLDLFRDEKHPNAPEPVYSLDEMLAQYLLLTRICSFILPTAFSLHEGRHFKTRGAVLFPTPITDQRVYRAFGDILLAELDCIPRNVTKNPVAVGFGNTHNAAKAWYNASPDTDWIQRTLNAAEQKVLAENTATLIKRRTTEERQLAYQERKRKSQHNGTGDSEGENISTFIEKCDPVAEMLRDGLLIPTGVTQYRWHESEHDRSCDILDGTIHVFSNTMSEASPAHANEPINTHRFYLYQLCGLDMTQNADKPRIREYLFEHGYGSDPKAFASKRNRKPIRLEKKNNLQYVLEPLKKSREVLAKAFANRAKFLGIRADTVVGKTHQAELYYLKGYAGLFSTPTGDLAKEVYSRFHRAGINIFLWRGIGTNPNGKFPHEKTCMFPDEYIALAEKGRNAYNVLCEKCPFRAECDEHGYRSQEEKAQKADVIVASHKELLMNPTFRITAKRLLPGGSRDLITIDEFDILESFIKVNLGQTRLEYLRDTWYDHPLGELAKRILDACVVQNASFTGISHCIELLSDNEREKIITALGKLRIGDTILDTDDAEDYENKIGKTSGLENIKKLPVIETVPDWNLLTKLELFFNVYHHAKTAPMEWKDNTLTFYVPPLPYYTRARVILMSATLNETFFRQVFHIRQEKRGDIDFFDIENTDWHPDVRVFQLRTNRNPRRTLLEGEQDDKGHWQYTSKLTQTGQAYLDKIKASIAKADIKCGFIGHKTIIDNHTDDIDAATGHFGGLVGLNQHFYRDKDEGILLHILGTPNIGQEALETSCKLLLGMTESPLNFTRNKDGTHDDPNVQTVTDAIVQQEMTQAVGRAGLAKNPSDVVIWSSYDLPSISHRGQTILFDETDWDRAKGNLDTLAEIVAERQAHEQAVDDAIKKGDAKAVEELTDVTERHARKLTQEPRQKNTANKNAERDASVIELHQQQMSVREIAAETGLGKSTVSRIIKQVSQNGHGHGIILHVDDRNGTPPTNLDETGVESVQLPKTDRDKKVIELHQQGKNQREIERLLKGTEHKASLGTVNKVIQVFRMRQPAISTSYSRLAQTEHPTNPDDTCIECKILDASEPEPDHGTFFKLLEISTCFYGKKQLSASDISQLTGIDESEVSEILNDWYKKVVLSPGIGEKYWMTERDKKQLWEKILGPVFTQWTENFPGQKILCPPITFEWIGTGPGDDLHVLP